MFTPGVWYKPSGRQASASLPVCPSVTTAKIIALLKDVAPLSSVTSTVKACWPKAVAVQTKLPEVPLIVFTITPFSSNDNCVICPSMSVPEYSKVIASPIKILLGKLAMSVAVGGLFTGGVSFSVTVNALLSVLVCAPLSSKAMAFTIWLPRAADQVNS